jgi:rhodanese-related sulfurtransferase
MTGRKLNRFGGIEMIFKKLSAWLCLSFLTCAAMAALEPSNVRALGRSPLVQESAAVEFITAEELKAKITRNEPVAIIDVRSTGGLMDSDNKIKGAVYVKLRRLRSRLAFPPLKDVPRNRMVVTYCACPNDESSVRAAQVLMEVGFKQVRVLKGGWLVWKKANGQVEPLARGM